MKPSAPPRLDVEWFGLMVATRAAKSLRLTGARPLELLAAYHFAAFPEFAKSLPDAAWRKGAEPIHVLRIISGTAPLIFDGDCGAGTGEFWWLYAAAPDLTLRLVARIRRIIASEEVTMRLAWAEALGREPDAKLDYLAGKVLARIGQKDTEANRAKAERARRRLLADARRFQADHADDLARDNLLAEGIEPTAALIRRTRSLTAGKFEAFVRSHKATTARRET